MNNTMAPICSCGRFMQCTRQNVRVLTHTVHEQPDAIYAGAQYGCLFDGECPADQQQTVTMVIGAPVAEHWQGDAFTKAIGQARERLVEAHHKVAAVSSKTEATRARGARMETHAPAETSPKAEG